MDRQTDRHTGAQPCSSPGKSFQDPAAFKVQEKLAVPSSFSQHSTSLGVPAGFFLAPALPSTATSQGFAGSPQCLAEGLAGSFARPGHGGFMESQPWAHPWLLRTPRATAALPNLCLDNPQNFSFIFSRRIPQLLGLGNTRLLVFPRKY